MNRLLTAAITALIALAGLAPAARAEVLAIDGLTPAGSPEFADIRSLAIDGFGGRDGRALAFELEDRLSAIRILGQPYFDVIGGRSAVEPDASLSGNVTADVSQRDTVAKRRRCVERDAKDKCLTYKDIDALRTDGPSIPRACPTETTRPSVSVMIRILSAASR